MAKWFDQYGILGLSEDSVQAIIQKLGTVMLKTRELVDVIETSLKSFKAFFQWLYSVILRLSDEPVPSYIKYSSQQDVLQVANFLQDQLKVDQNGKFSLERVGQYFEDKELKYVSTYGDTAWTRFVAGSERLRKSPLILHHNTNSSLVTLANTLQEDMDALFKKLSETVSNSYQCKTTVHLANNGSSSKIHVTQISANTPVSQNVVFSLGDEKNRNRVYLAKLGDLMSDNPLSLQATSFHFSSFPGNELCCYSIQDVQFYDSNVATVLLKQQDNGNESNILAQVLLSFLEEDEFVTLNTNSSQNVPLNDNPALTLQDVGPKLTHLRQVQGFQAGSISVSGSRKVCCMLSLSRRRVKLFDMDAEDDDDDDDEEDVSKNETKELEDSEDLSFNQ